MAMACTARTSAPNPRVLNVEDRAWARRAALLGLTLALAVAPGCERGASDARDGPALGSGAGSPEVAARVVGFGEGAIELPFDADPVGSAACEPCHAEHVAEARTNRMALTSGRVARATTDRWFDAARLGAKVDWPSSLPAGPPRYRRAEAGVVYETRDAGGDPLGIDVVAVLGSGHRGFTPIALGEGGIRELRLSYLAPFERWRLTPGSEGDPDPLGHVRSEETSRDCLGCHATVVAWDETGLDVEHSVFGIGCER